MLKAAIAFCTPTLSFSDSTMDTPIAEVYHRLSLHGKIRKDEALMVKIAPNTYLSVIGEPEWTFGKNETLREALHKRIAVYNAYAKAYNSGTLECSTYFRVKRPPLLAIATVPSESPYKFLGMAHKYSASYPYETVGSYLHIETQKRRITWQTMGKLPNFSGNIIDIIFGYIIADPFISMGDDPQNPNTLLAAARATGRKGVLKTCLPASYIESAFFKAAVGKNSCRMLNIFLQYGMGTDKKNEYNRTALMEAAIRGSTVTVKLLLQYHADVEANACKDPSNFSIQFFVDSSRKTALMMASSFGRTEIVQILLEHRANVEAKDKEGKTALDHARGHEYQSSAHREIEKLLLEHQANLYDTRTYEHQGYRQDMAAIFEEPEEFNAAAAMPTAGRYNPRFLPPPRVPLFEEADIAHMPVGAAEELPGYEPPYVSTSSPRGNTYVQAAGVYI